MTNNSLEWVQDFGNKGLKQVCIGLKVKRKVKRKQRHKIEIYLNLSLQVLSVLNECFRNDSKWDKVQHE